MAREDIRFRSGDAECGGWLFRPNRAAGQVPCVVLAHGFGALKEARLDAYAERFAAAGFAALVFDYRHFGASGGEPRQLVNVARQLDDWRAAVAFARGLDGTDPGRVALWGSSYGGGHVIAVASEDARVAAAISQAAHISGSATMRAVGFANMVRLTVAAMRDLGRAARGREPYYIPTVGPPGTLATMNSPDAEPGYRAMFAPDFRWRNEVAARSALQTGKYSPGRRAGRIRCPLLVQVVSGDLVTPPGPAVRAAGRAPRGELITYDGLGHFDIYVGEPFERAVADQLEFLHRHLAPATES